MGSSECWDWKPELEAGSGVGAMSVSDNCHLGGERRDGPTGKRSWGLLAAELVFCPSDISLECPSCVLPRDSPAPFFRVFRCRLAGFLFEGIMGSEVCFHPKTGEDRLDRNTVLPAGHKTGLELKDG